MSKVEVHPFGLEGKAQLFTVRRHPLELRVTNWGATIVSLIVPDRSGNLSDVVLGFDTLASYVDGPPTYFGSIVGRVANRISNASITIEGETHKLVATSSNPDITLHGGKKGFDKVLWEVKEVKEHPNPSVQFVYRSFDGEEGFPGDVDVSVTYTLTGDNELRTDMKAIPLNKSTPISLAQHTYWNLGGHGSGDILGHNICIRANYITPVNDELIPTGKLLPVDGTPFDFREPHRIGDRMNDVSGGYDHNFVLSGDKIVAEDGLYLAATVKEPNSGRVMDLLTDAPGMQLYTGNFLSHMKGKDGFTYQKHSGLCLETQGLPNAVNEPKFPSVVYSPGKVYVHTMLHRFYTADC